MKKLKPKGVNNCFLASFAAGLLIALAGIYGGNKPNEVIFYLGIAIILAGLIFRIVFYRCPHCEKYLDRSTGEYCPHCGKKVNE